MGRCLGVFKRIFHQHGCPCHAGGQVRGACQTGRTQSPKGVGPDSQVSVRKAVDQLCPGSVEVHRDRAGAEEWADPFPAGEFGILCRVGEKIQSQGNYHDDQP
ncbi:hypothetical protein DESC_120188 [Desulfosarcina cetonica]|nr:hypothetical protein DESC_120188 [Desulfosarcina cetonica]